jgi:hypothetical protein
MRFGLWNVMSVYRVGSLMTVSRELSRYKLDLAGMQEVRWGTVAPNMVENTHFSTEKGNENHELGTDLLCIRKSYEQLRGLSLLVIGCHI